MTTALLSALYAIVLTTAFAASRVRPLATPPRARWPWATTVAVIIVGIPSLAQFTVAPWLLNSLERNWTLIARGQVWRLLTSLVVQDGGVAGAIFNVVALAVIGFAAEQVWGPWRWTVIALSGALAGELWGKIVQPIGAGNSVAVFSLAASLAVVAMLRGAGLQRLLGVISLAGAALLLIIGDIHGGAATVGAVLGGVLAPFTRSPQDSSDASRSGDHSQRPPDIFPEGVLWIYADHTKATVLAAFASRSTRSDQSSARVGTHPLRAAGLQRTTATAKRRVIDHVVDHQVRRRARAAVQPQHQQLTRPV